MNISLKKTLNYSSVLFFASKNSIGSNIQNTLSIMFNKVYFVNCINDAYKVYDTKKPSLIISDINLDIDLNFIFLEEIREYNPYLPIILVSDTKDEKILFKSIRLQVIDLLIKPIKIDNFIYTLNRSAKHMTFHQTNIVNFNKNYKYNFTNKTVIIRDKEYKLTKNESKFLELMISKKDKLIRKEDIELYIWGEKVVSDSNLKSLVKRLKDKIGKNAIQNSNGHGYFITS